MTPKNFDLFNLTGIHRFSIHNIEWVAITLALYLDEKLLGPPMFGKCTYVSKGTYQNWVVQTRLK
jgi:hypothetical protein